MRTPIRKVFRKRKPKVNSGWHHWIDSVYGSIWSGEGRPTEPKEDGSIYVRKIWFSVRRVKKRDKTPKRIFRGCKYWRYMASEWGKTHWVQGMKLGRLKTTLEDRDYPNRNKQRDDNVSE